MKDIKETPSQCPWCGEGVSPQDKTCPVCFMGIAEVISVAEEAKPDNKSEVKELATKSSRKKTTAKSKDPVEDISPVSNKELNEQIQKLRKTGRRFAGGIDPGARYTGLSIRDDRGHVYFSSTYYRDDATDKYEWIDENIDFIQGIFDQFELDVLSVEGVEDPRGHNRGMKSPLNPRDIIRTGMVVGGIITHYRGKITIVRPRKNGSQVEEGFYPECLNGRRPKDLPGFKDTRAKTRNHEKSAYDVAGQALFATRKD